MRHKMNAIDTRSKAPRAQGGKGLLSHTISVQESQKSISKILILEKKRKNREEERGATSRGGLAALVWRTGKKRERKERVRGGI